MTVLLLMMFACNDKMTDSDEDTDVATDVDTEADTQTPGGRFDDVLETMVEELEESDAGAVSIAIYEDGEVVWTNAQGTTIAGGDVDVTPNTLFQMTVTTNVFTSVALLQGVDEQAYTLDTDLLTLLPDLAADPRQVELWRAITPHRLMTHQTGLFDFIEWDEAPENTLDTVGNSIYPTYLPFDNPPGTFWNYSYTNFSYAGLARQETSARPFADVLDEDVFTPLGMLRTTTRAQRVANDGDYALGSGFIIEPDGSARPIVVDDLADVPHPPFSEPAGTHTWTTPSDMAQMAEFLIHGDEGILSDALREQITTSHVPLLTTPDDAGYGYGLYIRPGLNLDSGYRETPVWEHGGFNLQYSSIFYVLPEQDYAVAILSSGRDTDFNDTLQAALELAPGLPEPVETPRYTIDTARFADHVGFYDGPSNFGDFIITQQDDGLVLDLPAFDDAGLPYDPDLEAVSSTNFRATINGATYGITFIGEAGEPSQYIRNRLFVARRTNPPSALRHGATHGAPSPTRWMGTTGALR